MSPSTYPRPPSASRAIRTAARLMSAVRSPSPWRFSMIRHAPKVCESRMSEPAST